MLPESIIDHSKQLLRDLLTRSLVPYVLHYCHITLQHGARGDYDSVSFKRRFAEASANDLSSSGWTTAKAVEMGTMCTIDIHYGN